MNQFARSLARLGFMAILMASFTSGLTAEVKLPAEILGPDGKPVEKATIYRVWMEEKGAEQTWGLDQLDLAEWKRGKDYPERNDRGPGYWVVESPGCALAIYQLGTDAIKLEKEFWVEGKVIDEDGNPVPDAEVTIGQFGLYCYLNVRLNPMVGKLPWVQTKTDKDGKYRLRGAVLNNMGFDIGVFVSARTVRNGKPMVGGTVLSYISDSPFFDEARKDDRLKGGEIIAISACDEISGVVVDAITGKPIERAMIQVDGLPYDLDHEKDRNFFTDREGKFSISGIFIGRLGVEQTDYLEGNVIPEEGWRKANRNRLEIKLLPLVDTTIQFIDHHSGKAPLVPMEFSYEVKLSAGAGWNFQRSAEDDCSLFYSHESSLAAASGIFKGKLPVGKFQFNCSMYETSEENSPYAKSFELNIPFEGDRNFNVELDRKPGLLFALNPVDSTLLRQNDKWDYLSGYMKVKESPYIHYVDLDKAVYFQPADKWDREMNFQVTIRKDSKETVLADRNFKATPDAWPVKIDAVGILGDLIKKDEK